MKRRDKSRSKKRSDLYYPAAVMMVALILLGMYVNEYKTWINHVPLTKASSYRVVVKKLFFARGSCYINDSLVIYGSDLESTSREKDFFDRIQVGDSLVKFADKDTLLIIRGGVSESFPLEF